MTALVRFGVLGALDVRRDGAPVPLGSLNQRRLLSVLLAHVGEVVSTDRLADIVWWGEPPHSAGKSLQTYVWRLRALLGPDVIVTKPPGYALGGAWVDAGEFERLLRDGALEEAIALWRGQPFAEFADEEWARPSVVRLEEMHATARELHIERLLTASRTDDAVAAAEALCAAEPFREQAQGLLMQALSRQGRAAEALRAFDTFRTFLAQQTGLEPSAALREIERAVLAQDRHVAASGQAPRGTASLVELPSGTVTFLCTELDGSTRLRDEHPHVIRDALVRHDAVARDAIGSHSGRLVSMSGDGTLGAFATAHDAIGAAISAQRVLGCEPLAADGPLLARMGIDTGSAEARGDGYVGASLNRAAQLMAVAHGGQVIVARATQELVGDALGESVELVGLGEVRLRDLAQPVEVFQVAAPGLVRVFPALQSLEALPGNLPLQHSSFVGREREVAELAGLVGEARIVTLTGVGGVGKTRLALRVAAEVSPRFRHGAWLVELARIRDPSVVVDAVAAVFAVTRRPEVDLMQTLVGFLRSKEVLLVLDNCEHLLGSVVDLMRALEGACPMLVVLATSREGLAMAGERMIAVPPLGLPGSGARDAVMRSDAAQLFVDRAVAVRSDFVVTDANAGAIADVVRRLDGIPLALELAASRVPVLSPAQLARRLDQRFRVLAGGERGAVERHATLRAAIDWSYDLLTDDQRRLLARLSVFAGGCSLEAAEAVCSENGPNAIELLDLLSALVARSLVQVEDVAWGDRRYRLLETIRQYAEEQLQAAEHDELRDRHTAFYVDFVETAARGLRGPNQQRWLLQVEPELENVRTAMAWAVASGDAVRAERFLSSAVETERSTLSAVLLRDGEAVLDLPSIRTIERYPFTLAACAVAALFHGMWNRAEQLCEQALRAAEDPNDEIEGWTAEARGQVARATGDSSLAIEYLERAASYLRRSADPYHVVRVLNVLAAFRLASGDVATAAVEAREALSLARHTGNPGLTSSALAALANVLVESEPERSRTLIAESLELTASHGLKAVDEQALALTLVASARLGDFHQVLTLSAPALERGFTAVVRLGVCLEMTATALAPEAPEASTVLHAQVDALVPHLAQAEPHVAIRERDTAVIDVHLDASRIRELRAQGAAMTPDEAIAYAVDAIARVVSPQPR